MTIRRGSSIIAGAFGELPSQTGQSGKYLTTNGSVTSWSDIQSGSFRNIGEIVTSTIPLTDAELHLLDGALISGGGIYDDFVQYIAGLSGSYPQCFTDETTWQNTINSKGVCGKFVYNSINNTVRLPKITGFIEGTVDSSALGELVEAGLPNIIGQWAYDENCSSCLNQYTITSGAFTTKTSLSNKTNGVAFRANTMGFDIAFDASLSSSIYGNSNTVQPQSIKVFYYIVIATATKTDIEVDIDEIAIDLNGKADTDLSNINSSGKSFVSGLSMPSSRYIDLTLGASGSTYIAPANGWFCVAKRSGGTDQYLGLISNGLEVTVYYNSGMVARNFIPAKKRETITVNYNMTGNTEFFRFIYAEGESNV